MYTINFWPVLTASVVAFGIGALWYSPFLFGREWMSLVHLDQKEMTGMSSKSMLKRYLVQFVAIIVTFCILAFIISSTGSKNAVEGAFVALIAWLGFVAPQAISGFLWKKEPMKLVLIDSIDSFLSLVIGGAIIGAW